MLSDPSPPPPSGPHPRQLSRAGLPFTEERQQERISRERRSGPLEASLLCHALAVVILLNFHHHPIAVVGIRLLIAPAHGLILLRADFRHLGAYAGGVQGAALRLQVTPQASVTLQARDASALPTFLRFLVRPLRNRRDDPARHQQQASNKHHARLHRYSSLGFVPDSTMTHSLATRLFVEVAN